MILAVKKFPSCWFTFCMCCKGIFVTQGKLCSCDTCTPCCDTCMLCCSCLYGWSWPHRSHNRLLLQRQPNQLRQLGCQSLAHQRLSHDGSKLPECAARWCCRLSADCTTSKPYLCYCQVWVQLLYISLAAAHLTAPCRFSCRHSSTVSRYRFSPDLGPRQPDSGDCGAVPASGTA